MNRDSNVDYKLLKAYEISYTWHQPWQLGLFHADISGKFVWYPERGTLMREGESVFKIGEFTNTEDVIKELIKQ